MEPLKPFERLQLEFKNGNAITTAIITLGLAEFSTKFMFRSLSDRQWFKAMARAFWPNDDDPGNWIDTIPAKFVKSAGVDIDNSEAFAIDFLVWGLVLAGIWKFLGRPREGSAQAA